MKKETISEVQTFIFERMQNNINISDESFKTYRLYFNYISRNSPSLERFKHYIAREVKYYKRLSLEGSIYSIFFTVTEDIFLNCFN